MKAFSCCLAEAGEHVLPPLHYTLQCLAKANGMGNPPRTQPFISWPWGCHSWAPYDCKYQKDSSQETITLRILHRQQTETDSSLPVKRPIYLSWSFSLMNRVHVSLTPRGYKGTPRERKEEDIILVDAFILTMAQRSLPKRSLHAPFEPQILQLSSRGHLQVF